MVAIFGFQFGCLPCFRHGKLSTQARRRRFSESPQQHLGTRVDFCRLVLLCLSGFMKAKNLETVANFQIAFKMFVQTWAGVHMVTKKLKEA